MIPLIYDATAVNLSLAQPLLNLLGPILELSFGVAATEAEAHQEASVQSPMDHIEVKLTLLDPDSTRSG